VDLENRAALAAAVAAGRFGFQDGLDQFLFHGVSPFFPELYLGGY
jgi:hypothetical protein